MKTYLLNTFAWNDSANNKLLEKIKLLPDKTACIKFFSHLVNCQYKWMARIKQDEHAFSMSWWDPVYTLDELADQWKKSLDLWLQYIDSTSEEEMSKEVTFIGFDGGLFAATPMDIALQLNYHSIHHRHKCKRSSANRGLNRIFLIILGRNTGN
jgi:uncharacterized damage-inducible protein DinB